ncbi:hypothetical protein [Streptomyces sp. NPDC006739]|uniref:hypothetical protein n=1 Tax=Streptomyces sp. NPDC006739 TaxID=3364763 RepID=UPI0036BA473D
MAESRLPSQGGGEIQASRPRKGLGVVDGALMVVTSVITLAGQTGYQLRGEAVLSFAHRSHLGHR